MYHGFSAKGLTWFEKHSHTILISAFSHPSTNQARPCLASEIRRDRARSGWYGRRLISAFLWNNHPVQTSVHHAPLFMVEFSRAKFDLIFTKLSVIWFSWIVKRMAHIVYHGNPFKMYRDSRWGPVVKTASTVGSTGSIPVWGAEIPYTDSMAKKRLFLNWVFILSGKVGHGTGDTTEGKTQTRVCPWLMPLLVVDV